MATVVMLKGCGYRVQRAAFKEHVLMWFRVCVFKSRQGRLCHVMSCGQERTKEPKAPNQRNASRGRQKVNQIKCLSIVLCIMVYHSMLVYTFQRADIFYHRLYLRWLGVRPGMYCFLTTAPWSLT